MRETKDEIKLFYDLTAEKTADAWYQEEILKPTIEDFVSLLPNKPRILDLGCGTGHESMRISETGATVVGIDYSEKSINIARKRARKCQFEVVDFRNLDSSLGKFEGVFACASLIHINNEQFPRVLKNIKNVIKKDGYVALIILEGEGIKKEWSLLDVEGEKLNRTVYLHKKKMIEKIAEEIGLKFFREGYLDEKLKKYGWKNYIFKAISN